MFFFVMCVSTHSLVIITVAAVTMESSVSMCKYCGGDDHSNVNGRMLTCTACPTKVHERCAIRRRIESDYSVMEQTHNGLVCECYSPLATSHTYTVKITTPPIWMRLGRDATAWQILAGLTSFTSHVNEDVSLVAFFSFIYLALVLFRREEHLVDHWITSNLMFLFGLLRIINAGAIPSYPVVSLSVAAWLVVRVIGDGFTWLPLHVSLLALVFASNAYVPVHTTILILSIFANIFIIVMACTLYRYYRKYTGNPYQFDFSYTIKPSVVQ